MDIKYDFIVSYSKNVYDNIVEPVIQSLEELGFLIWIDRTEVTLGTNIYKNLDVILNRSKKWSGAIVFIDNTYMHKKWCIWESNFFIENQINCYPILYRITKDDLIPTLSYYKNFNLATVKDLNDLSITVDKILMSYIDKLSLPIQKFQLQSKLLSLIINYYEQESASSEEKLIISETICQILKNIASEYIANHHTIKILINLIHKKVQKLYQVGTCTRYEFLLIQKAIQHIINGLEVFI